MSGRFTMDEIAGDTLALADELGWDEFDLVGHSMGGMAAQQVLAAEPRRVRRSRLRPVRVVYHAVADDLLPAFVAGVARA